MFDRKEIDRYTAGGKRLREAVAGLSPQQLQAFPIPGTWSIQQIVVHLADSDAVGIERMKRVAALDNPLVLGYDESLFIERLFPHALPVAECLDLFDLNRRLMAQVLRELNDAAFDRTGIHNERGKMTLGELVVGYSDHLDHHLGFIAKKRALLGA